MFRNSRKEISTKSFRFRNKQCKDLNLIVSKCSAVQCDFLQIISQNIVCVGSCPKMSFLPSLSTKKGEFVGRFIIISFWIQSYFLLRYWKQLKQHFNKKYKVKKYTPKYLIDIFLVKSTQYKKLAPNALQFTYQNLKSCTWKKMTIGTSDL